MKMKFNCLLIIALTLSSLTTYANEVMTTQGLVLGKTKSGATSYTGIPYAKAPVGDLRWRAPKAALKWTGTFKATKLGKPCPQIIPTPTILDIRPVFGREDCLNLNIHKPEGNLVNLPVMVFIHGGAQIVGSNYGMPPSPIELYNGDTMAKSSKVIMVSLNYRLGALSFISYGKSIKPNLAILDLILGLKWVQKNIAAFGGNPNNITIFGESAGAANVLTLLASPLAKNLFHRAIVQSGYPVNAPLSDAKRMGKLIANKLECTSAKCLRSKSVSRIVNAIPFDPLTSPPMNYAPVIDGHVLKYSVRQTFKRGLHNKVPIILGTNENEMKTLLLAFHPMPIFTDKRYEEVIRTVYGQDADSIFKNYPIKNYKGRKEALEAISGDAMFQCPTRNNLRALSQGQRKPIYRYIFAYNSKNRVLKPFKAGHGLELPYVFGNFPFALYPLGPSKEVKKLSQEMMGAWTTFAKGRVPKKMSEYRINNDNYLEYNTNSRQKSHFRSNYCDFWETIL